MSERYTARFNPQAWVNDYAIDVDPEGEQEWDCSTEFARMPQHYQAKLLEEIGQLGQALDGDDWLKGDPEAPEWVREWHGPFDIHVRPAEMSTEYEHFLRAIAELRKEGEDDGEGGETVWENDDAFETLQTLISGARALLGLPDFDEPAVEE